MAPTNPLVNDADVAFLLHDVHDTKRLCTFPAFADHTMETFELFIGASRRLAHEVLFPAYRAMDQEPPRFSPPDVHVHPAMHAIFGHLVDHGCIVASRPPEVSGLSVPLVVNALSNLYLMAGNAAAYAYAGLTTGAAHLIEAFGDQALQEAFMAPMYAGRWTGTMALTEPQAGSSLSDVATRATPMAGGVYSMRGAKVFISGGEQDMTENIVHMTLARIDGAPPGIKGVSLFAIPKKRRQDGLLVDNDVRCTGVFHKMGWKGIPSVALDFGESGDCHGYLVGQPNHGIAYMFQMMNEARIMVGMNGVATASVAYHESLEYARSRPQGRPLDSRDPSKPQVPIIAHADVRRMLLRQKAIMEGAMSLVVTAAYFADVADHGPDENERKKASLLLDLLTPVAKSFPAERGFESNALAVQIHGGYGYTSEYLPEAWLRDQKLNSIHEGTTGIQSLDLLGRKVVAGQGAALQALGEEIRRGCARATAASVRADWVDAVASALTLVEALSVQLAGYALAGTPERMLAHSADYLDLMGALLIGWQWLVQVAALAETGRDDDFARGKRRAAQYWIATELPRIPHLAALCRSVEDSYVTVQASEL